VADNATKAIERYRANRKKQQTKNSKKQNLTSTKFSDFDEASQQRIQEQVQQADTNRETVDTVSVASSVTSLSVQPKKRDPRVTRGMGYIFIVDVQVLTAGSQLKQVMPVSIQSNLPHIIVQFGEEMNCPFSSSIRCAVDTCAALSMGSFQFYASVAKRFPHCVAKVFAPKDYSPIVLSGMVQSSEQAAVTTKLEVGWQFHLPYKTKGGDNTSFAIATGPHVSVNNILELPFMQATAMIIDFVDNIAECKHISCPPFTIYFQRTSNHVLVMDKPSAYATVHKVELFNHVVKEIENLERYYEAKVQAGGSNVISKTSTVYFGSKPQTYPLKICSGGVMILLVAWTIGLTIL
jgi:hypothetical protein